MDVRRMPLGVMIGAPLLIGLAVFAFTTQEPVPDPNAEPSATATLDASAPTATSPDGYTPDPDTLTAIASEDATANAVLYPPIWTPTPVVAQRGSLREGAWVRVNAGAGDCLNARNQPSLGAEWVIVQSCLPDGFEGYVTGTARENDGHWWWYLAGAGWVAEDYLTYLRDIDLTLPQATALAGEGRIAFLRGADVWVMNADGSNQRLLVDQPDDPNDLNRRWVIELRWSPDGSKLSYSTQGGPQNTTDLHIVTLVSPDNIAIGTYPGILGGAWSPDGTRIGIIRDALYDGMGGGAQGQAGVLELATGLQTIFDTRVQYYPSPPEFNFDGSKLLIAFPAVPTDDPAGGPPKEPGHLRITDAGGMEITRITQPENGFIAQAHWSPTEDRIAFHLSDGDRPNYAIWDLRTGSVVQRAPVPQTSSKIGGRCGGADMWRLDWNRDGTAILYSFSSGDTGANGVWTWDLATDTQRVTLAAAAGAASPGTGHRFVFATYDADTSHIFWAREGDAFPSIIATGERPVWTPE